MNPPPPEHQASSSSNSKCKRQPNDGESVTKLSFRGRYATYQGRLIFREWTHRPSILASSPASADEETELHDHHGGGDGTRQWRPWADIATPLLDVLLPRFSLLDRVLLSSVCRPWHDFLANHPSLRRLRFPWLMIEHTKESVWSFCSLSDDSYYILHLANTEDCVCAAASHGWLLFLNLYGGFLVNPLSKACIDLPTWPKYFNHATFSAAPTEPSCTVLGLSRVNPDTWNIYYWPIKDKTWHVQQAQFVLKSNIAVMGRKFYFLCHEGLVELDFSKGCLLKWLKLNDDIFPKSDARKLKSFKIDCDYHWLMESNGELLVVTLLILSGQHALMKGGAKHMAYVHRADFANKIWANVEDLGGRSLFLSRGACFSLPAVDDSEHARGCIYASNQYNYKSNNNHLWQEYIVCRYNYKPNDNHIWQKYIGCRGYLDRSFTVGSSHLVGIWFMPTI